MCAFDSVCTDGLATKWAHEEKADMVQHCVEATSYLVGDGLLVESCLEFLFFGESVQVLQEVIYVADYVNRFRHHCFRARSEADRQGRGGGYS